MCSNHAEKSPVTLNKGAALPHCSCSLVRGGCLWGWAGYMHFTDKNRGAQGVCWLQAAQGVLFCIYEPLQSKQGTKACLFCTVYLVWPVPLFKLRGLVRFLGKQSLHRVWLLWKVHLAFTLCCPNRSWNGSSYSFTAGCNFRRVLRRIFCNICTKLKPCLSPLLTLRGAGGVRWLRHGVCLPAGWVRHVGKLLLVGEQIGQGRPGVHQQTVVGVQTSWQNDKKQN